MDQINKLVRLIKNGGINKLKNLNLQPPSNIRRKNITMNF